MTCANCGEGILTIVQDSGGVGEGHFSEVHDCPLCGATGTIHGRAERPQMEWERTGAVFGE